MTTKPQKSKSNDNFNNDDDSYNYKNSYDNNKCKGPEYSPPLTFTLNSCHGGRSTVKTYYEILGIKDESANQSEIKAAHRSLALKLHPDKADDNNNDNHPKYLLHHNVIETTSFMKIQEAWECLRDSEKRKSYDESLQRMRERNDSFLREALLVNLSDMNCEICDVLDEDDSEIDDIDGDGITGGAQQQTLYSYACRCGDNFEILEENLMTASLHTEADNSKNGTLEVNLPTKTKSIEKEILYTGRENKSSLWHCQSCSLAIKVVIDIPLPKKLS